eukprot:CAMPEP_0170603432 /NCGR_PEP_ID=MMETSP0224-20130122/18909_1 /TAXON_ID=285029 /ORGANISM="Togula jolla, Strain CCCM 725" /LENGTH=998 /DNA_ID=CAMNT_0010928313 /DNA_START=100 /DNA_END=3092 /DNA_ORIENTATION=+
MVFSGASWSLDIVEALFSVISGAQSEILFFVLAICIHKFVFGGHRKPPTKNPKSKALSKCPSFALSLNRKTLEYSSKEDLLEELAPQLGTVKPEDVADLLANLLETFGLKEVGANLLKAVHEVARTHAADGKTGKRLGTLLLQGYNGNRLQGDFDTLFQELQISGDAEPRVVVIALKSALRTRDIPAAVKHMRVLVPSMEAGPSAPAPTQLLQQLTKVAVEDGAFSLLLEEMKKCHLQHPMVLEALLQECTRSGNGPLLAKVEDFISSEGIAIPAACLSTWVRVKASESEAARCLAEAVADGPVPQDLLAAVAEVAQVRASKDLAQAVLKHLPSSRVLPATAAALLRLTAQGLQSGAEAILELYEGRLGAVSLATEGKAERIVAEAAIQCQRLDVLQRLMAASSETSRQVSLLKSFAADNRLEDAFHVFQACQQKTVTHYNALLDACADCQDTKAARRVFADAISAGLADVVTYNTIIKAHLQKGDLDSARAGLESMRAAGLTPTVVTFNEMLDAVVRNGARDTWLVIRDMEASGLKPNHITCSILLKGISASSSPASVERILKVVEAAGSEMDEVSICSMIEACIRAGRSDLLLRQLKRLRKGNRFNFHSAHAYGSVIRAFGFLQDMESVWSSWREMRSRSIALTSITLGCMVEAIASNGRPDAAYDMIREALKDGQMRSLVNSVIYGSVLKAYSQQKNFQRVWAVYQEMLEQRVQCSIVTCNTLVDACARSNEMGRVESLLQDMSHQGVQPNIITYSAIIKGYCQFGRLDKAFQLLEEMKRTTPLRPDELTYNTLMNGCARQNQHERGMRLLQEMQDAGVSPTNYTLSVLVKLAGRSMKLQQAFDICEEVSRKYKFRLNVHVYANLIQACLQHSNIQRAMDVLKRMVAEEVRPDVRSYTLLLRGLITGGQGPEAAALLRAAFRLRGAHQCVAGSRFATPIDVLSGELVTEILEGIARQEDGEAIAGQLLQELLQVPKLNLDPKLSLRLVRRALNRG